MNETEKTIEHFHYGITHDIFSEPVTTYARLAVDALREQAKRSKGCDYCGLIYKLDGASYGTDSVIIENRFCPMCGKRLEATHEQN